jgi:hypothetical protein
MTEEIEMTDDDAPGTTAPDEGDIVGAWTLVATEGCDATFPSTIELLDGGIYLAPSGPVEGAVWHGGDWTLVAGVLSVMAADDEMLAYDASVGGDLLRLTRDGCRVDYRRTSPPKS